MNRKLLTDQQLKEKEQARFMAYNSGANMYNYFSTTGTRRTGRMVKYVQVIKANKLVVKGEEKEYPTRRIKHY